MVDWTAVTGISTGALAAIGLAAAVPAYRQFRLSRQTWKDEARAYVSVDFESNPFVPEVIEFVVRNTGRTAAFDVQFRWQAEPVRKADVGSAFADAKLFKNGIPTMAPGREVRIMFDSTLERFNDDDQDEDAYPIEIAFTDVFGVRRSELFVLDPEMLKGTNYVGIKSTHDMGKSLETIAETIKGSGLDRGQLGVVVETIDQRRTREKRWRKERRQSRSGSTPPAPAPPRKVRGGAAPINALPLNRAVVQPPRRSVAGQRRRARRV